MPAREHVQLIEQIDGNFHAGALDAIDELASPSLAGFTREVAVIREAFPDVWFTIEDMADRYTISGTNTRPFPGIAATGRKIQLPGITHRADLRREDRRTLGRHRSAQPAAPAGRPPEGSPAEPAAMSRPRYSRPRSPHRAPAAMVARWPSRPAAACAARQGRGAAGSRPGGRVSW
jgi:hypothetical protein